METQMSDTGDDREYQLTSNNPAMTVPASSRGLLHSSSNTRHRSNQETQFRGDSDSLKPDEMFSTHSAEVSNPACQVTRRPPPELSKYDRGWRRVVRNFSPSWFSVTMGTGITSLLFIAIPYQAQWLYWLSVIFFILNLIIFILAAVISILRYTLYREIWKVMIQDPTNSLFLGTIPMGLATLIESFIFLCCPYWGPWATYLAWAMWLFDSMIALAVTTGLSFILMSQSHPIRALDRMTAAQLLPIAATIVASGTGAEAAGALMRNTGNYWLALGTLIANYVLWGMSQPFAIFTLVIYYQRLTIHKLPPREIIVSSFLPLGPLGMGGYTIMYLGARLRDVLPHTQPFLANVPIAGDFFYLFGIITALIMWAFGLTWFMYALAAIYSCGKFPFNMGWWGFTFPLGVMAVSTIQMGLEFPSAFFRVLGTIFAICVILLWIVVFCGTLKGAWGGHLFYAPCLKDLPKTAKHGACVKMDSPVMVARSRMANTDDHLVQKEELGDLEKGI